MFGIDYRVWLFLVVSILLCTFVVIETGKDRFKHVFIESNSIGCDRYRYDNSYYWVCDDKNIKTIEVRRGKIHKRYEPVVNGSQ